MKTTFKSGFPDRFIISVSCASGTESVLKKEISRLFGVQPPAINGRVELDGNPLMLAKCNINLRTADRVYVKTGEFTVKTFDELYDAARSVRWEDYLPSDGDIPVDGKCVKSALFAVSDCQSIVKKAIADRLCGVYGLNCLPESGAEYKISFSLFKDVVCFYIDSSGTGLHKRGYRDKVGVAPIKETLASAMLLMSDFYRERPFVDPFCGSGTFLTEGARIALNIAPGIGRKFAFDFWKNFDGKYCALAYEEAKDKERRDFKPDIRGYDIDKKAIELTLRHAERAGLKNVIRAEVLPINKFRPHCEYGTIVTNPPYGERVYGAKDAENCYKELGNALKGFDGWSVFVITPRKDFEKLFGKKSDRERKLYNSNKECRYYFYYGKKGNRFADMPRGDL
ncbi:MAG: class I SAM-dependent RNA methyltransferase [Clostridia bacterium]|nr:class I SAM-dependent RNA methyltransferase [Clostridia bacterium]